MKNNENLLYPIGIGVLSFADYLTTKKILKQGGKEYNPIVNFFIKRNCFGLFKVIITSISIVLAYSDEKSQTTNKCVLGLYSLVVAHNIKEIIKMRKINQ